MLTEAQLELCRYLDELLLDEHLVPDPDDLRPEVLEEVGVAVETLQLVDHESVVDGSAGELLLAGDQDAFRSMVRRTPEKWAVVEYRWLNVQRPRGMPSPLGRCRVATRGPRPRSVRNSRRRTTLGSRGSPARPRPGDDPPRPRRSLWRWILRWYKADAA